MLASNLRSTTLLLYVSLLPLLESSPVSLD
jgi:hypothetical protein